jgi:hypothetical protein
MKPERVNHLYRDRHPANRNGSVDGMLGALCALVVAGTYCLLTWGGS